MKKTLALGLVICLVASAFCITTFASDLPASDVTFRLSADISDLSATDAIFDESYIMLAIAVVGLIATVVSAILIAIDRRKEVKASREKEADKEQKTKNNKKGNIS